MRTVLKLQGFCSILMLTLLVGCQGPSAPVSTVSSPKATPEGKAAVLQQHWKLVNFGAPW